jgi:hypothetical protein
MFLLFQYTRYMHVPKVSHHGSACLDFMFDNSMIFLQRNPHILVKVSYPTRFAFRGVMPQLRSSVLLGPAAGFNYASSPDLGRS